MLEMLSLARDGRSKRVSSFDRTGRNRDAILIEKGATVDLANIEGAGVIRHIWFTISCEDELYLRKLVLRMYWDGRKRPSVEAPVGDFFGVGHAKASSYQCAALNMSANLGQDRYAAMNCYFPMPFREQARIEIQNEADCEVRSFYYYVDYDELERLPDDQLYFHAWWRRENPCTPPPPSKDPEVNLTDEHNYLILDAEGRGHYVGCNLSVHNLYGGWWGEGDDMFMIDGQKWPPDLHGTGSEDYFSHAWGMQVQNSYIYNGVSYNKPGDAKEFGQRITVYRYHLCDPVVFHKSIRVSIEHGHANDRCDDYSSTAYWYQTLPNKRFPRFPKVADRLPRQDLTVLPVDLPLPPTGRRRSGSPIDPAMLPRKGKGKGR